MAYTVVQSPSAHISSNAALTIPLSATAANNFLAMAWTTAISSSETVLSVVDSAGNNWTSVYNQQDVTGNASGLYFLPSASNAGGITSVTITFNQSQSGILAQVKEYSGLFAPVTALDKTTNVLSSVNPCSSGPTATTTQNNELVIGVANTLNAAGNPSWTVGAGYSNFTSLSFNFAGPVFIYLAMEDKEVTTQAAQTATFVNPNSASTGTAVATFKETSSVIIINPGHMLLLGCGA